MKALISDRAGKYLFAFAGALCLFGLITGEAAGASVKGQVTKNGVGIQDPIIVVATTTAPNYTFLNEATTDASGNYIIPLPNMKVGTNFLVFPHLRGTPLVIALDDTIEKTVTFRGNNIDIEDVNFAVVDGVLLSGNVRDSVTDSAADGVIAFATNPDLGWKFLGQKTTDANGDYGILVPPDERVELAVATANTRFADRVVDPVFIPLAVRTSALENNNFTLKRGIKVKGTVTEETPAGPLVPGTLVEAFFVSSNSNVEWRWLDDSISDGWGRYSVKVDPTLGMILLRATAEGFVEERQPVELPSDSSITEVTANIVLSTSVQIRGRVTDEAGNGVDDILVAAFFDLTDPYDPLATTWTHDDGFYVLNVAPDSGLVSIHVNTTGTPYVQPFDLEVVVRTADILDINFTLIQAVTISGTVRDAVSGLGVPGAYVAAKQGTMLLADTLTGVGETTPPRGTYTLKVAPDLGEITIHVDGGDFYSPEPSRTVEVGIVPIDPIDFVLVPISLAPDEVSITKAQWTKGVLTVFATSNRSPEVRLSATARDRSGVVHVLEAAMTYSAKRNQYELRKAVTANIKGGQVTVVSTGGGEATALIR